jgi:hypothetical protein
MGARRLLIPAAVFLAAAGTARAQITMGPGYDSYEQRYGEPVQVRLEELIQNPDLYRDRSVRTNGRLDFAANTSTGALGGRYAIRDMSGNSVRLAPVGNLAGEFEDRARFWLGHDIEVTGVLGRESLRSSAVLQGELLILNIWSFVGPEDEGDPRKPISAKEATLETLVTRPGRQDGKTVRVVGKFRGRNLYGDLPVSSQRNTSDWVIKDDVFAVWVSGKKPKGSGWELDPGLKRDTGKWIEVVGRVETRRGVTYLRAMKVALTNAPSPVADAKAPPPPPPRPKLPPVIVFALPLDGEGGLPTDSRFVVQFNKDMDKSTFAGRVQLRYAGPVLPGDRAFDAVKLTYDDGRRALTVDPGDVLRPGRTIELVLLPGIADIDGLTLVPREPARTAGEAVEVLQYRVGT